MALDLVRIRLSTQRALIGAITPNIRAVTIGYDDDIILFRTIFDRRPSEWEIDLMQCAGTEIVADFSNCMIDEQFLTIPMPADWRPHDLECCVYARYEPPRE